MDLPSGWKAITCSTSMSVSERTLRTGDTAETYRTTWTTSRVTVRFRMSTTGEPFEWAIPAPNSDEGGLKITIRPGDQVYLVGPNGTGKSALIQHCAMMFRNRRVVRIAAHRQNWMQHSAISLTQQSRNHVAQQFSQHDSTHVSRYVDHQAQQRTSAILFDLVSLENSRNQRIADLVDSRDQHGAARYNSDRPSVFKRVNRLLELASMTIRVRYTEGDIEASHDYSTWFSMAKASDGERSAVLIAAHLITAPEGSLLIVDEPERHLHRAITEPFLRGAFRSRQDCAFVIATHQLGLVPSPSTKTPIIRVRSCEWAGDTPKSWTLDKLTPDSELPEDLKMEVLGAKDQILFVEGTRGGLDTELYSVLYPGVSVVAKGGCAEVMRAVKGLRESAEMHRVQAFGLIDRDDRDDDDVAKLREQNIHALDVTAIESLYYCEAARSAVAKRHAETVNCDQGELLKSAVSEALSRLGDNEIQHLCALVCERRIRHELHRAMPSRRDISNGHSRITIEVESPFSDEKARFRKSLASDDFESLVRRYALRESGALDAFAKGLKFKERNDYEAAVLAAIQRDTGLLARMRNQLKELSALLLVNNSSEEQCKADNEGTPAAR